MTRQKDECSRKDPLTLHYRAIGPAAIRAALLYARKKDVPAGRRPR